MLPIPVSNRHVLGMTKDLHPPTRRPDLGSAALCLDLEYTGHTTREHDPHDRHAAPGDAAPRIPILRPCQFQEPNRVEGHK